MAAADTPAISARLPPFNVPRCRFPKKSPSPAERSEGIRGEGDLGGEGALGYNPCMSTPDLITKMRATVAGYGLFAPGQTVVIGVSGGPDSTALLHALVGLRREWGLSLVAAHLDHGFRGAEAEGDADYVAYLCAQWEVPCHRERIDVPALCRRRHLSAQEAAREVRHAFLRRTAAAADADRIALAHTRSDRIETVLLNVLRGTGLEGLGALPPIDPPLVRPLIDVERALVEAYCDAQGLHPRHDSSNDRPDYRRNRLRAELLPYLATYYNERVSDALVRLADLAAADNALLEALTDEALARVTLQQTGASVRLNGETFRELPPALQRRVLRRAIRIVRGHLQNLGFAPLESVLKAIARGERGSRDLPFAEAGPIRLRYDRTAIEIVREVGAASPLPWKYELQVPGSIELPRAGMIAEVRIASTRAEVERWQRECRIDLEEKRAFLFAKADVTPPLVARSRKPGDRIRPRGLGGRKKLQDLFTDAKVPRADRENIPILVDADGEGRILAVVGLAVEEGALVLEDNPGEASAASRSARALLLFRFVVEG
jgi:tRNA(Ile)-lysidine synthase